MVVLAALLLLGAVVKVALPKRSLAAGKKWRVSSAAFACKPSEHRCGSATTNILFHTKQEKSPWFEVDLAAPVAFREVLVHNRADSFPERAVPLVLELSDDQKSWREAARIKEPFQTWKVVVPGGKARYLRLRVDRVSTLHLEGVEVYLARLSSGFGAGLKPGAGTCVLRKRMGQGRLRGLDGSSLFEPPEEGFIHPFAEAHVPAPSFNPAAPEPTRQPP